MADDPKAVAEAEAAAKAKADADAKAQADKAQADTAQADASAKAAADARTALADLVADPENLGKLSDADVLKLHERVKASIDKRVAGQVPEWATKRIDNLTGKLREEERKRIASERQAEELKAGKPPVAVSDEEINARAAALAAQAKYDEDCLRVIAKGKKEIPKFDKSIAQLHQISPAMNQQGLPQMPRQFVEAVIELDDAPRMIAELAKPENNDEAARIMALAPAKQGVALAKFASRLKPAVEVSKAPAPPAVTVSGRARGEATLDDPSVSMSDWVKLREADLAAKRKAGLRV